MEKMVKAYGNGGHIVMPSKDIGKRFTMTEKVEENMKTKKQIDDEIADFIEKD